MLKRLLSIFLMMILFAPSTFAWQTPRWAYLPINVYIEEHPKKPIVEKALSTWQSSSGEIVSFRMKNAKLASSLRVKFSDANPRIQKKDFEHAVGLAVNYSPAGFYSQADVTIFLKSPVTGEVLDDRELYEISLHEIGHALGLSHSNLLTDIMYPQVHGQSALSANDLDRLKHIYLPD